MELKGQHQPHWTKLYEARIRSMELKGGRGLQGRPAHTNRGGIRSMELKAATSRRQVGWLSASPRIRSMELKVEQ